MYQEIYKSSRTRSKLSRLLLVTYALILYGSATSLQASGEASEAGIVGYLSETVTPKMMLHPQYDYLESDLKNTELPDPEISKRDYFRRAFFGFTFDPSQEIRVYYLTDYSQKKFNNQIARLEWKPNDSNKLYLGYQKAPFLWEDTTPSSKVKPIERSVSTRFWNEVVGLGSYHSGVYYTRKMEGGIESTFGLTHNIKSQSDWPDILNGDVSLYSRWVKRGRLDKKHGYLCGVDLAYQAYDDSGAMQGLSLYSELNTDKYKLLFEAVAGEIDRFGLEGARPFSWHVQYSNMLTDSLEGIVRASSLDTGSYGVKLSSAIRKAPFSGFQYDEVDSLYLGFNYYLNDNKLKLSLGYELGEGRNPLNVSPELSGVYETISGFRVRGHVKF